MKKMLRYSEATLLSLLVASCGGSDDPGKFTPINIDTFQGGVQANKAANPNSPADTASSTESPEASVPADNTQLSHNSQNLAPITPADSAQPVETPTNSTPPAENLTNNAQPDNSGSQTTAPTASADTTPPVETPSETPTDNTQPGNSGSQTTEPTAPADTTPPVEMPAENPTDNTQPDNSGSQTTEPTAPADNTQPAETPSEAPADNAQPDNSGSQTTEPTAPADNTPPVETPAENPTDNAQPDNSDSQTTEPTAPADTTPPVEAPAENPTDNAQPDNSNSQTTAPTTPADTTPPVEAPSENPVDNAQPDNSGSQTTEPTAPADTTPPVETPSENPADNAQLDNSDSQTTEPTAPADTTPPVEAPSENPADNTQPDNSDSQTTEPTAPADSTPPADNPNGDDTATTPAPTPPEPIKPYQPSDPQRIFDEAAKFSQNGMVENLLPSLPQQTIDDERMVHKIAVVDTDFTTQGTGDLFKNADGQNRLLLNPGVYRVAKGDKSSHGTKVAGVMAMHNKTSLIYAYSAESSGMTSPTNEHFETAHAQGARIFNNSYGDSPIESLVKEKGWRYLTDHRIFDIIADMGARDSIFVWAAGNEGSRVYKRGEQNYASTQSHIPVRREEAKRGWITVAAVQNGRLTSYSNKIGAEAQNWGIAATGDWEIFGGGVQGTSFAAPVVAAAAATVWEKFPWMSHHLVTQTLLSTADKLGTNQVTTEPNADVGWGVLNQTRALNGPARFDTRLLVSSDQGFVTANFSHRNYQDPDRLTWRNDIVGDAGFKKQGTGTLYLSGRNSYSGETRIEGGVLGVSNALLNSAVTIEKNGTLLTNNATQPVELGQSLTNNGSLNVYGKGLHISGNYTTDPNARTVIDIHSAVLDISGTADMQGSRILADVEQIDSVPTQAAQTKTILRAGTLTGYNGLYTISDNIARYIEVTKIAAKGNEIEATYKRNQTAYVLRSAGSVSRSAANAGENLDKVLDEVAGSPNSAIKSDSLAIMRATPYAVSQTVETLSAEIYASSKNLVLNESRRFSRNLAERAFTSLGSAQGKFYSDTGYNRDRLAQDGYVGADSNGYQTYLGGDKRTGNSLFGAAFYAGTQNAEFDRFGGKAKLKQQGFSLYAGYDFGGYYLLGQAGVAGAKNSITRTILIPNDPRNVKLHVKSTLYSLYGESGYRFKFERSEISPFIGYQFDAIQQKGFNEGQYFGIRADRHTAHLNSYVAGIRAGIDFGKLQLNGVLSHTFTPNAAQIFDFNARYVGAESQIRIAGISASKHTTAAKVGVNYHFNDALSLSTEYGVSHSQGGAYSQNMNVGLKYQF